MQYLALLFLCFTASSVSLAQPSKPLACGPVCDIYCPLGNVLDAKGCPTCRCQRSPCDNEALPLRDYFCGRGLNRRDCPSSHFCKIAPNDAYAVCCPRSDLAQGKVADKTVVKQGSCPPPSDMFGICIARCSTDGDCGGNLKCCGSCPRTCVQPVL